MSRKTDYEKLKQQVITRANYKCEYCLSPEITSTQAFEIEHIIPFSKKGKTILENLALSCSGCNKHKFTKTQAFDKISKTTVELFHPRKIIGLLTLVGILM